jgi:hypothetical protein
MLVPVRGCLDFAIEGVMQSRVEPLSAKRAREMSGIADQKPPAVGQARDDPPVHPGTARTTRRLWADT